MSKKSCPAEVRLEKVSSKTGKAYKKWVFIGWGLVPDPKALEIKGSYGYLTREDGTLERYDLDSIVDWGEK
jgi:hypothetical protein